MIKKYILLIGIALICFSSCNKHDDSSGHSHRLKTNIMINLDPSDYTIAHINSEEGDSIFIYGDKDESGLPVQMRDVMIYPHDEDGYTEIFFDESGLPTKVIAPNEVVMLFEWIDPTTAAFTMIDPTTDEQLNTVLDFSQNYPSKKKNIAQGNNQFSKRDEKLSLKVVPLNKNPSDIDNSISNTKDMTGHLYLSQCGVETDAQCWVDAYSYSGSPYSGLGKRVGRLKCTRIGTGEYQYVLPQGMSGEHHDLTKYCSVIMTVLNGICETSNMLGPGYKEAICIQLSAYLAAGFVTAPIAAHFLAACTALNYCLDIFCRTSVMQASIMGGPMGEELLCNTLREMGLEWDDPLLLEPIVNGLPNCIRGIPVKWDGTYPLPDLEVIWGGKPQISQFYLSPSAPVHGEAYEAIADFYCLNAGSIITLSISGTDGYSDSKVFVVGDEINYRAILNVPGANDAGVEDVCTVKLELPDGTIKTKRASLVFN